MIGTPAPAVHGLHEVPVSLHAIDRAVRSLRACLDGLNYNPQVSRLICISAGKEHSLTESIEAGWLEAEDIEAATEAFIAGWPEVDPRSVLWKNPDRWTTDEHPTPEESRQYAVMVGDFDAEDAPLEVPPDACPDWDEFALWSALQDAREPMPDYLEAEYREVGAAVR